MRALVLDGVLQGRELAFSTADLSTVARNIRAEFKLADGNLDVRGLEADLLHGHVTATATMQHLGADSIARVHASMQAISLSAANDALRTARVNAMPLDGQISGTAEAAWTGEVKNVKAHSDVTLNAALTTHPGS